MRRGGDFVDLLGRFADLRARALMRTGALFPLVVVQKAGLDGFWLRGVLEREGVESHVADAASVATSRAGGVARDRQKRRRGARVHPAGLQARRAAGLRHGARAHPRREDRRRLCREFKSLVDERVSHANCIRGVPFTQGTANYNRRRLERRVGLEALRAEGGRPLPLHVKAMIGRDLDLLELLSVQIDRVRAESDALVAAEVEACSDRAAMSTLLERKGVGPNFAEVLWSESLFRHFDNRRQLAAYAGLAPTPWQSGFINHEQGVSRAGNPLSERPL